MAALPTSVKTTRRALDTDDVLLEKKIASGLTKLGAATSKNQHKKALKAANERKKRKNAPPRPTAITPTATQQGAAEALLSFLLSLWLTALPFSLVFFRSSSVGARSGGRDRQAVQARCAHTLG